MEQMAPEGPIYQAGTLSGNPIAVAAGLKTLEILEREDPYPHLAEATRTLCEGFERGAREAGVPVQVHCCGSMFTTYFSSKPVTDFSTAKHSDADFFVSFFQGMLRKGIYLAPSQFEAGFVSAAHSEEDLRKTAEVAGEVLKELST